jgi:outer membrane protein, heavy metal efflux system
MKQIINTISFFLLLIATGLPALAQQVPVLSLDTILARIENQHPALKGFGLKAEAYKYSAEAATAWMAPMVGIGTFMTPYPGQKVMDDRDKGALMLRLEQQIPNRGKLQAKKAYIESQADVTLAGKDILFNDYKAKAKSLYYAWIVNKKRLQVLESSTRIMETMKKVEEVRYPYNQSLLTNIYKAESRIEDNLNMATMYRGEMDKSRAWLNSLMNEPGNYMFDIDTLASMPLEKKVVADTIQIAMQRKDILQMDANIQSMQLGIRSMELEKRPEFKVAFDHMNPLGAMMPYSFSAMGMISIPIVPWASKMYKNEIKAMQYNVEAMQQDRAAMLTETRGMLFGMQSEIRTMQQRIINMESKVIPVLQRVFDAGFLNYQDNKAALSTVLADWEAVVMMKMNVLDEQLKLYEMIIAYEKELYQ